MMAYRHTQKGPWHMLLYLLAVEFSAISWFVRSESVQSITFLGAALLVLLLAPCFHHLTLEDADDQFVIRFGPLPLFRKRLQYEDICEVEKGRTTFLDGWGIHWKPWGGWVWNIWGFDCVIIRLRRGIFRVGTDDPDRLVQFLRSRTATAR
jgi:hypothetical protein